MNSHRRAMAVFSQLGRIMLACAVCSTFQTFQIAHAQSDPDSTAPSTALSETVSDPQFDPQFVDALDQTITYAASDEDFLNPERGFYKDIDLLNQTNFPSLRSQGFNIAYAYIRLANYRDQDLPDSVLQQLDAGFNRIRSAGMKVVPRFSYTSEYGGAQSEPDASLDRLRRHLQQISPIFNKHADVILVVHAGFIGAWGEWHHSSNNLTSTEGRAAVMGALLANMPKSRAVQFRYPRDLLANYPTALASDDAYSGSDQSRVAHHNDCFLANYHDSGTWIPENNAAALRQYIAQVSLYTPVGGETCSDGGAGARDDCVTAQKEMATYHWSYIDSATPSRWSNEGCRSTISRSLGYRFRLTQSTIPAQGAPGQPFALELNLVNDGYASPFNPRAAEIILRNLATKALVTLPINNDPRRWLGGQTQKIALSATLPAQIAAGAYEVLLNLPDPAAALRNRPEYSIRVANANVWESSTGYNKLNATVQIQAGSGPVINPAPTPTPIPASWKRFYMPVLVNQR